MTLVAPTLQAFFSDRLTKQQHASSRTIAAYRDTFSLLLRYVQDSRGKAPSALEWDDLDEPTVTAFLEHLKIQRRNSARTTNLRLTAIRSLFRYAAIRHPEHAAVITRVLSIPPKRFQQRTVTFLTDTEAAAVINAPPTTKWEGRRDRAMLTLTLQAGLRVSELVAINCGDITLGSGASVEVQGKGRKHRAVPLTKPTTTLLAAWIAERDGPPADPLFPTRSGRRLSRDAVEQRVTTHVKTAAVRCPSLKGKHVHPHVLRHSCAMALLHAGVDTTVIALWLGHADVRSTQPYIHADMTIKERALALVTPVDVKPGRYKPADQVLAFLESLG